MYIHIPTVITALIMGYGLLALQMSIAGRVQEAPELSIWNGGNWAFLAAFLLLATRAYIPLWISVIGGNALICLALALYSHAIYQFLHGHGAPRVLWILLVLECVGIALLLPLPLNQRTSIFSVMYISMLLPGLWQIAHYGWFRERSLRMAALALAGGGLALGFRGINAWLVPSDYTDLMQSSVGQALTFLGAFIAMLGSGFGFILAALERSVKHHHTLATIDGLTGCINRSAADALLSNALLRAQRGGESVSLVMMDLDHFKNVNDRFGHRTGDEVLRRFAQVARTQLRASDVLARMGGEEFALILPSTDVMGAVHVAESLRAAIEALAVSDLAAGIVYVTLSAGAACAPSGSTLTGDQLYQLADAALYRAKAAGRNRVEVATELDADD
jgi:diguanylate cyclase (GGDEF)-like protein